MQPAEYRVDFHILCVRVEVGIGVLPDNLLIWRHLEHTSPVAFSNQCVTVGETLRTRDGGAKKFPHRRVTIFPDDLAALWGDLNYTRVDKGIEAPIDPIIEDENVAVGQERWIMLTTQDLITDLPDKFTALLID